MPIRRYKAVLNRNQEMLLPARLEDKQLEEKLKWLRQKPVEKKALQLGLKASGDKQIAMLVTTQKILVVSDAHAPYTSLLET